MDGNPLLWLAWALFGSFLVWLLWTRYRPAVLQLPVPRPGAEPGSDLQRAGGAPPAWLFCEDGTVLDRKVRWFPIRPGGRTVVGSRARAATPETQFVYLTADDIPEDHVALVYRADTGRYEVEALNVEVLHNNDSLAPGRRAALADGDTLDLGRLSRFRFTLTGPEATP